MLINLSVYLSDVHVDPHQHKGNLLESSLCLQEANYQLAVLRLAQSGEAKQHDIILYHKKAIPLNYEIVGKDHGNAHHFARLGLREI